MRKAFTLNVLAVASFCATGIFTTGVASGTTASPTQLRACSDLRYVALVSDVLDRHGDAIEYVQIGAYQAAKAASLRAWREVRTGPLPCRRKYAVHRPAFLTQLRLFYEGTVALAAGNITRATSKFRASKAWADKALALQQSWT
jgi:hypothetical protein